MPYYPPSGGGSSVSSPSQPVVPGKLPLGTSTRLINLNTTALSGQASNNYDLYTVPDGKRAFILGVSVFNNATTTTANLSTFVQVKTNGLYYRISPSSSAAASELVPLSNINFIADAGETIGVKITSITSQASVRFKIFEFDTSSSVSSSKLYSFTSGNNTIFISSLTSSVVGLSTSSEFDGAPSQIDYFNGTSGSVVVRFYIVPSGQTTSERYRVTNSNNVSSNVKLNDLQQFSMGSGDSLIMFSGTASFGQVAWFNHMES